MRSLYVLMFLCGLSVFSQKNEIKLAQKEIKKGAFDKALKYLETAESLVSSADVKTKASFYIAKARAYSESMKTSKSDKGELAAKAIESINKINNLEGAGKYAKGITPIKTQLLEELRNLASKSYEDKDYLNAASYFNNLYYINPADTIMLYNAAISASLSSDYMKSLGYFENLKKIGYTGITKEWYVINKETGKEEVYSQADAKLVAKDNKFEGPKSRTKESQRPHILRSIALMHSQGGDNEKAIQAIEDARKEIPDDSELILTQANIHYKMGDQDKFSSLLKEALEKDPNNEVLYYNLGVTSAGKGNKVDAIKYYEKAIELKDDYKEAYLNLSSIKLESEKELVDEMNKLGMSSADQKKYQELNIKRKEIFRGVLPHLEKVLSMDGTEVSVMQTLMNIYGNLEMDDKFKEMKEKVDAISN